MAAGGAFSFWLTGPDVAAAQQQAKPVTAAGMGVKSAPKESVYLDFIEDMGEGFYRVRNLANNQIYVQDPAGVLWPELRQVIVVAKCSIQCRASRYLRSYDFVIDVIHGAIFATGAGVPLPFGGAAGGAVGKGGGVVGKAAQNAIGGFTKHGLDQAIERGFKTPDILKIVRTGKAVPAAGRYGPQVRYSLGKNTVVVDFKSKKVISVFSDAVGSRKGLGRGDFIPY